MLRLRMHRFMVLFNYSTKELTAKVVYYGAGLCGKTTNLQWIHEKLPIKNKGKMLSLATETDRTLFFDFLPIELGTIRGMKTRIQLYTVPGQVFYNATRRMVLKGADCVVFVCDSQEAMLEANLESFENLRQNLEANEIDPDDIPLVLQYNKRDLPNALPIEILNERLNQRAVPFYEAVAVRGSGVEETLKGVTGLVFRFLASKYGGVEGQAPSPPPPRVEAPPAPRPPVAPPRPVPASATLPPLDMGPPAAGADELLDSLELQPAPEGSEELGPDSEAGPLLQPSEEIETIEEEPPPPTPLVDSRTTLVAAHDEAQDLRRRIGTPSPDVNLDEINDEEQGIEEISLDSDAELPLPPPSAPLPSVSLPPPRNQSPSATIADRPVRPVIATAPVTLSIPSTPGQTDISIPVDLTVGTGTAQVNIHLRLSLNLKLKK